MAKYRRHFGWEQGTFDGNSNCNQSIEQCVCGDGLPVKRSNWEFPHVPEGEYSLKMYES